MPSRNRISLTTALAWVVGDTTPGDKALPGGGLSRAVTVLGAAALSALLVVGLTFGLLASTTPSAGSADQITIRLPDTTVTAQMLAILDATPGVLQARALTEADHQALLAPWLGADLPLNDLGLPTLIEAEVARSFDAPAMTTALANLSPTATLLDHRAPARVPTAALWQMTLIPVLLSLLALIILAGEVAFTANTGTIATLRLIGARDGYITRIFSRRAARRVGWGAFAGTVLAGIALWLLNLGQSTYVFALFLILVPLSAGALAYAITHQAALRRLKGLP